MTEPTVQVPVSLIERTLLILHGPYAAQTADEYRALLSQPTPTAEHTEDWTDAQPNEGPGCTCGFNGSFQECAAWRASEDAPPSIADMAPGTTFTAQYQAGAFHGDAARWRKINASVVALVPAGTTVPADKIDPSTIRDVQSPAVTE